MTGLQRICFVATVLTLLIGSTFIVTHTYLVQEGAASGQVSRGFVTSSPFSDQRPLSRIALVASDSSSYVDEFAYFAAVPTGVFVHNNTQYVSPVIYSSDTQSETWLVEDWAEYLETDGGTTQGIVVGDYSEALLMERQLTLGAKVYPRITGLTPAEMAAKIAVSEWVTSSTAVVAISDISFVAPDPIVGSASHTLAGRPTSTVEFSGSASQGAETSNPFTPPSWAAWMHGRFNYSTSEVLTHRLVDPNGNVVDYSDYTQIYFSRNPTYVDVIQPMQFWFPVTSSGQWIMNVTKYDLGTVPLDCEIAYHPGFRQSLTVPAGASNIDVTLNWNNVATDLNLALVDPTGRLVMWAPAGSILSSPGVERISLPYPMPGEWTIIAGWMDASSESNDIELQWEISFLPSGVEEHLESAANAAVLASLLNVPLLYVDGDQIPAETQWALTRLGVTDVCLVDPVGLCESSLLTDLGALGSLVYMGSYSSMVGNITALSGSPDIVISGTAGNGNAFIAPSAYAAAVHGAPVFSVSGDNNELMTRAQETWAPYLVGPEINNIYVIEKYENRAENGWYDERIPNQYSMMESVDAFEDFLSNRGAYNSSATQPVVIVAPESMIPSSFDRSLQSHFNPGRIPAETPEIASVFINRGLLHRYLFLTAESADTSLVSMYAYTDGSGFLDNYYDYSVLTQIENTTDALEAYGFSTELHVGADVLFDYLDDQVALWSLSTHGTLTLLPRDPPSRPGGPGFFSLRNEDSQWGFEESELERDKNGDSLVNPVVYAAENQNHVTRSGDDLDSAVENIGSPIVILTACLLGGSEMPLILMEHGAVAVTASPRTVYFQPAGMLSVLMAQSLCAGETVGAALSNGLQKTSWDYSDPLVGRDPADYANQQILYGDPSVRLYEPGAFPRVAAVNPRTSTFGNHRPGRGIDAVAALGETDYLPSTLNGLGVDYDYYTSSNLSEFLMLLSLRSVTIVEPDTLSGFASELSPYSDVVEDYVRAGGNLAVLGVDSTVSWLPWPVDYSSSGSGSSVTVIDLQHPLMTSPNSIPSTVPYQGHFSSVWGNLTVIATDGSHPVAAAGTVGFGKLFLCTLFPSGTTRDDLVQNIVAWYEAPSITLRSATLSQMIIWAGDRLTITLELTDAVGNPVESAAVGLWIHATPFTVTEESLGFYRVRLGGNWTQSNVGEFDITITARLNSYDSLTVVLHDFFVVRPFPWAVILVVAGGGVVALVGYVYLRRRRGEQAPWRQSDQSREERERQREEDSKVDPKEFFGV
ncbi:hypothetical protein EU545_04435 [Candidatus Thorarchaeota archaeon]|nr:MAG: hypothetical protein EU545_04435 [Candidatus Thorarchaeota archaeon]